MPLLNQEEPLSEVHITGTQRDRFVEFEFQLVIRSLQWK
jgi:phenol hydroxylase P0 protein